MAGLNPKRTKYDWILSYQERYVGKLQKRTSQTQLIAFLLLFIH